MLNNQHQYFQNKHILLENLRSQEPILNATTLLVSSSVREDDAWYSRCSLHCCATLVVVSRFDSTLFQIQTKAFKIEIKFCSCTKQSKSSRRT